MVYKFFDKKFSDSGIKNESMPDQKLSEVLHKPILENLITEKYTSVSKNVYIDKLDDIINKYNNTYHNAVKMKPVDIKLNTYIHSSKKINNKDPKFKIVAIVRISK